MGYWLCMREVSFTHVAVCLWLNASFMGNYCSLRFQYTLFHSLCGYCECNSRFCNGLNLYWSIFWTCVLYFPTWKLVVGALELSVYLSSTWHGHVPSWGPRLAVPAVACVGWGTCLMVIRSCADHFRIEVKYVCGLCVPCMWFNILVPVVCIL
jgi:hypothetical protein